jgi:tRNA pseudouridine32 synthase/23S rRNA pseudouridine746 synthase
LSVPGKIDAPSIYDFVKAKYPEASGPLIVHRLDMSTSGIMLIAKTEEAYYQLQQQFIKRTVKKTYIALLDGVITEKTGVIDLPLRVDLDDRPRQLICFEHGKPALTHWEVLKVKNNQTKIAFYPHSGRTHQLRVHAAHHLGLNTPIVGDDLYGKKANRLHLHAKSITFEHPKSKQNMNFEIPEEF